MGKGIFTGLRGTGREVSHLQPSSAEVKNEWSYTPRPMRLHGMGGDSFTFLAFTAENTVARKGCKHQVLTQRR
jgi:hypothetical protein